MNNKIITRVAPSPTGWLHIGTSRTALFNYLFTKKNNGKLILRIDDTDRERSTKEFENNIFESLAWLGISFDEQYRQSERSDLYRAKLEELIAKDKAYVSTEAVLKEGDRDSVIRFRNPGQIVTFADQVHGDISFDTTELGDFIIAKDFNTPLYHFASVVDDVDMGVTHVIRGDDHISNTPRQILMIEALGGERPTYAHIPLILASDRSKLSKRHGAVAITEYAKEGYLPEGLINFMALLGWSPQAGSASNEGTNEEVFSLTDLVERFSLEGLQKSGAIFNVEKLKWLNKEHLKLKPVGEIEKMITPYLPISRLTDQQIKVLTNLLLERISTIHEVKHLFDGGEFDFLFTRPNPNLELIKNTAHLPALIEILETIDDTDFTAPKIKEKIWDFATEKGRADVLGPMRTTLTGLAKSPDPFIVAELLGKEETIARLQL
jgi:glutamyl-tRNA synthetase